MSDKAKKRCQAKWPLPSHVSKVERRCRKKREPDSGYCKVCLKAMGTVRGVGEVTP